MKKMLVGMLCLLMVFSVITAAGQREKEEEKVELTLWTGREQFMETARGFEQEYPHIKLNVSTVPFETSTEDFVRNYTAGIGPDVFQIYPENRGVLAERGMLLNIDDFLEEWKLEDFENYNKLIPAAFEGASHRGVVYGLGLYMGPRLHFYRIDWLEKAGLDIPQTWDELLDAARILQNNYLTGSQYAYALVLQPMTSSNWFQHQYMSMGGQYDDQNLIQLDSPAGHEALSFYQTLAREKLVNPETIAWVSGDKRGAIFTGNTAMATVGDNVFPAIQNELEFGVEFIGAPMPTARGGIGIPGTVYPFMVNAKTKHPEEVMLLLKYMARTEQIRPVAQTYVATTNKEVMTEAEYFDMKPWQEIIADEWENMDGFPGHMRHAEVIAIVHEAMEEAISSPNANIAEMARAFQVRLNALNQ